jgi:aspartyl-tRNA(Asn)/glutamyl-tRNA(Gln) amidotransferase subunit A
MTFSRRAFLGGLVSSAASSAPADGSDLCWLSVEQAGDKLRRKSVSPVDLTRACLERIEKLNPSLNCFITVTAEQALSAARKMESELSAGPRRSALHGIPIALKDLFDTAGIKTTAGSEQYENRVPAEDAEVVRKLKAAGAILLGKLNMDEFAYNYTAETSRFGPSRNPWDTKRSPGGSSGGSAVAVAAGMCFAALGSDTGGSIRLPAAFCGITGFKPTYGRVSTEGAAPLAWSLDHVGPMCRSARDAASVLSVIAESGTRHPASTAAFKGSVKSVRIGTPRAVFWNDLHTDVERGVSAALKTLEGLTAGVRDVKLPVLQPSPEIPELPLSYLRVIAAEAYTFHEDMLKRTPERYHPGTRKSIENGRAISTPQYIRAVQDMQQLRAKSGDLFRDARLLVTPAAPAPAFRFGDRAGLIFLRNSAPWNLYGLPSISIPCAMSADGMPIGLQITGPAGGEDLVLALAAEYQRATDWHTRRPPV